jgi:hypothetical protein
MNATTTMTRMILPLKTIHEMISMMLLQVSWSENICEESNRRADPLHLELRLYRRDKELV